MSCATLCTTQPVRRFRVHTCCIHTYTHTYMHCFCLYGYICICIHIYTYIHKYLHTCMNIYMYTYIHTLPDTQKYTRTKGNRSSVYEGSQTQNTYIHSDICTCIFTCVHTYIYYLTHRETQETRAMGKRVRRLLDS